MSKTRLVSRSLASGMMVIIAAASSGALRQVAWAQPAPCYRLVGCVSYGYDVTQCEDFPCDGLWCGFQSQGLLMQSFVEEISTLDGFETVGHSNEYDYCYATRACDRPEIECPDDPGYDQCVNKPIGSPWSYYTSWNDWFLSNPC